MDSDSHDLVLESRTRPTCRPRFGWTMTATVLSVHHVQDPHAGPGLWCRLTALTLPAGGDRGLAQDQHSRRLHGSSLCHQPTCAQTLPLLVPRRHVFGVLPLIAYSQCAAVPDIRGLTTTSSLLQPSLQLLLLISVHFFSRQQSLLERASHAPVSPLKLSLQLLCWHPQSAADVSCLVLVSCTWSSCCSPC